MSYFFITKQLLNNALLFISFLFIWGQFFKDKNRLLTPTSPVRIRVLCGITAGVLGIFLMSFFMREPDSLKVDFRNLAIIISAMSGGFLSSLIAGTIMSCFSVIPFAGNHQPPFVIIITLAISIGCGFISKLNIHKVKKWICMIIYTLILHFFSISMFKPFKEEGSLYKVFIVYSILTIALGFMVYNLLDYINQSNLLLMKFKEDSSKDFLTGLNNVRKFDSLFNDLSKKAIGRKEGLSLIMIDIDWFKKINDTYGHPSGDAVLIQVSEILKTMSKTSDIVSRNGGEEFSLLLISCSSVQAIKIAEQIRKEIEKYEFLLPAGNKINVTVSVGVATYPDVVNNVGKLIESTDIALYEAKRTGRNKVVLYN